MGLKRQKEIYHSAVRERKKERMAIFGDMKTMIRKWFL